MGPYEHISRLGMPANMFSGAHLWSACASASWRCTAASCAASAASLLHTADTVHMRRQHRRNSSAPADVTQRTFGGVHAAAQVCARWKMCHV